MKNLDSYKKYINLRSKIIIVLIMIGILIVFYVLINNKYDPEKKEKTLAINKMINSAENKISQKCDNYFDNKTKELTPDSKDAYKLIKKIVEDENKELGQCISDELNLDELSNYDKLQRIYDYLMVNTRYKKDNDDSYKYPSNFLHVNNYKTHAPVGDCEDAAITIAFILNNTEIDFPFYILETDDLRSNDKKIKNQRTGHIVIGFNKKDFDAEKLLKNKVKYYIDENSNEEYFLMELAREEDDMYKGKYKVGKYKIGFISSLKNYKTTDDWNIVINEWK
jgi:hypothetical protein